MVRKLKTSPKNRERDRTERKRTSETTVVMMSENHYCILVGLAIPDKLWEEIMPLIPPLPPKNKAGRTQMDDRQALTVSDRRLE
jgi:hypothetical protein